MMKTRLLLTMAFAAMMLTALGANVKETVSQVSATITVTDDMDYIINGDTPFTDEGMVDLQNTTHAVLIIERVKPSKVISTLLAGHVRINGAKAQNDVNCQVRLYGTRGSMILPYARNDNPLTVYSEQNFQGDQCSDFGLENDGGYIRECPDITNLHDVANAIMRTKYELSEELALQRHYQTSPEEYAEKWKEYCTFADAAADKARQWLGIKG